MTIEKKAAVDRFDEEVKKQVAQAVLYIDKILDTLIHGSSMTVVYEDMKLPGINFAVFEAVIDGVVKEYSDHGWKVNVFDVEDPSKMYFVFS